MVAALFLGAGTESSWHAGDATRPLLTPPALQGLRPRAPSLQRALAAASRLGGLLEGGHKELPPALPCADPAVLGAEVDSPPPSPESSPFTCPAVGF